MMISYGWITTLAAQSWGWWLEWTKQSIKRNRNGYDYLGSKKENGVNCKSQCIIWGMIQRI